MDSPSPRRVLDRVVAGADRPQHVGPRRLAARRKVRHCAAMRPSGRRGTWCPVRSRTTLSPYAGDMPDLSMPENNPVPLVEALLDQAATRLPDLAASLAARPTANRAMLICACITHVEAPTWLIYEDPEWRNLLV